MTSWPTTVDSSLLAPYGNLVDLFEKLFLPLFLVPLIWVVHHIFCHKLIPSVSSSTSSPHKRIIIILVYIVINYKALALLFEAQCRSATLQLKTWRYWAELLTRDTSFTPGCHIWILFIGSRISHYFVFSLIIWWSALWTNQNVSFFQHMNGIKRPKDVIDWAYMTRRGCRRLWLMYSCTYSNILYWFTKNHHQITSTLFWSHWLDISISVCIYTLCIILSISPFIKRLVSESGKPYRMSPAAAWIALFRWKNIVSKRFHMTQKKR